MMTGSDRTTRRNWLAITPWLVGAVFVVGWVFVWSTAVSGSSIATALYSLAVNSTNTGSTGLDDITITFPISVASLIDGDFIADDALNTDVHKGSVDIPNMPPTTRIQVEAAVTQDGDVFTDVTTAAQNATQNDVAVLPVAPLVGDAFYFGCDNACRIITFDVDTAGVNSLTLTYEHWDGDSYVALSNVDDRTSNFTVLGRNTVSWDMPVNWATQTVTSSATTSFWGRARVSAFTSQDTQPLASRVFYETGLWNTWAENLDVGNQEQVTLFLGGAADIRTRHQIFTGDAGIVTTDAATLETTGTYAAHVFGRLDFAQAGGSTFILNKTGAITVTVSGSASAPAIGTLVTDAFGSSSGDVTGITVPGTGEQNIIIAADGSNAATFVDAGGGMVSYQVRGVTDNGNNWSWTTNGGIDYSERMQLDSDV
ncbi:hypothetical protein LCGC14_2507120, partial [marine sediment metagenome]